MEEGTPSAWRGEGAGQKSLPDSETEWVKCGADSVGSERGPLPSPSLLCLLHGKSVILR